MSAASLLGRLIVPTAVLLFAFGFYLNVRDMDVESRALPELLIAAVSVMSLVVMVQEIRRFKVREVDAATTSRADDGSAFLRLMPIVATFVLTGIYILWAIPTVGFYTSSFFYCLLLAPLVGLRSWHKLVTLGATVALVSYLVFGLAFGLRLPQGWLL